MSRHAGSRMDGTSIATFFIIFEIFGARSTTGDSSRG